MATTMRHERRRKCLLSHRVTTHCREGKLLPSLPLVRLLAQRCPARLVRGGWSVECHPGSFCPKGLNFASAKTTILAEGRAAINIIVCQVRGKYTEVSSLLIVQPAAKIKSRVP